MRQVRAFNKRNAGTIAYWCLRNVRMGYGIDSVYNDAWQAWQNTPRFTSSIPKGVDVPIYFRWVAPRDVRNASGQIVIRAGVNYGHIAVHLADGRVWSDGKYFTSPQNLVNNYLSGSDKSYVGWSTHVNNVQVIKENNMFNGKTAKEWFSVALGYDRRIKNYQKNYVPRTQLKQATDSLSKQRQDNERLTTQNEDLSEHIGELGQEIKALNKEINEDTKAHAKELNKLEKENKRLQDEVDSQDGTLTALGHLRMAIRKALHLQ